MIALLRRFFRKDFGPPPQPNTEIVPHFEGHKIVEVFYSKSKTERAFVTTDEGGVFRVYTQWWDTSDWSNGYGAFWASRGSGGCGVHTDTLSRACDLAAEQLGLARDCS